MDWFKNLKIKYKLFFVFGMLMSMVIILAVFAVSTISSIEKQYAELFAAPQQRLTYASDAVRELTNIRRYILSMGYSAENAAIVETYSERYQSSAELFMEYIDLYYENLISDTFLTEEEKEGRKEIILGVKSLFINDYMPCVESIYQASAANDRYLVNEMVLICIPIGDEITQKLDTLRDLVQNSMDEIRADAQSDSVNSKNTVIAFSVCIFMLALIVSAIMARAINAPIVKMESAMEKISKGDLTYPIRSGYKDELGALSNRIGNMVDTISELNKTVAVVDYLDDMICVTDLDYNLIYINRKLAEAYGVNSGDCAKKKCYNYIKGLDEPCSFCLLPQLLPQKDQFPSGEYEFIWDERLNMWISGKSSLIRWVDGSVVQFYMIKDDTLKKEHEERQKWHEWELREAAAAAEDASRAKSAFLANMSHEIRTPMNSIVGFSELAVSNAVDPISPKTKEYFAKIMQSSEGLLQIINDILDISKIESGKIELESIPFNLHEVFQLCQTVIKPKAMEKDITLYCYAEPSIGKKLLGDPTRLRQALLNILSNAIKFTNTGVVKLLSSIIDTDEDSVTVHFEVKDSGIGMTQEQIARIFDPFMQADNSTTRKYGGTGLGLSITKNIVELMGGGLMVESAPGIGSKFSFELTFKTINVPADAPSQETAINELEKPSFQGEILLCEDNGMNQQVICEHLSRVGLHTVVAANGKEGVAIVQRRMENGEKPFDLILMDIHMPIMDGLEAASKLGRMDCETPIVAITANIMSNDRETYRSHGMPDCVAKPFTAQELWSCLLKYLTPVKIEYVNEKENKDIDEKLRNQLLSDFVKSNQTTFVDINNAIDSGDMRLAHRLAHTLKGIAGLIGRTGLQEAAFDVERMLSDGKANLTEESMIALKSELDAALLELAPLLCAPETQTSRAETVDKAKALELFNKLEPLLKAGNPECLELIDNLREIPGTGNLIEQMEDFDFRPALLSLAELENSLEAL